MPRTLQDFIGDWHLGRAIDDRRASQTGRFVGTARLTPDGNGLLYVEQGQLHLPGATPVHATRRYLWRPRGSDLDILFDDHRPFHSIALDQAAPTAHHDCAPDTYDVAYDFTRWPTWRATWSVTGPRKDYTMTSTYTRP